jgi:NADPH:quinone reductase-like Zn-dependent oxidoreductase
MNAEIPPTMRAVRLQTTGGPEALALERIPVPRPAAGEALIQVHAAAITRDELEWPVDRLPAIVSYEFSGRIVELGPDVDGIEVGQSVFALSGFDRDGAAAEYTVVLGSFLAPKPQSLDHVASAAIPLAALSAWQGLFDHGGLTENGRVLILGAAGGVGSFAVQLALTKGAHVIGTASSANVDVVRNLGIDEVIDHTKGRFEEIVRDVDLVFDTVGGELLERSASALQPGGVVVSIADDSLSRFAETDFTYFVVEPNRKQLIEIADLVDRGVLRPLIDEVFDLGNAQQAFERSLGRNRRGKIVLRVRD